MSYDFSTSNSGQEALKLEYICSNAPCKQAIVSQEIEIDNPPLTDENGEVSFEEEVICPNCEKVYLWEFLVNNTSIVGESEDLPNTHKVKVTYYE
jgi:hypothetical protein